MGSALNVTPRQLPSVSVVVCAFNAADFIERALSSALAQNGVEIELIVIDDASTDRTVAEVEAAAERDQRIKLVKLATNGGPSVARNAGLRIATGEWLAVLDADDTFLPGRLQSLVRIAESAGADIIADNLRFYELDRRKLSKPAYAVRPELEILTMAKFLEGARPYTGVPDLGLLKPIFRADLLRRTQVTYPDEVRQAEDYELVLNLLQKGARYAFYRRQGWYAYTRRRSGWSRTPVNYAVQVERTRWLADQPAFRADAQVVTALHQRADALVRYGEAQARRHARAVARSQASLPRRLMMDLLAPQEWRSVAREARAKWLARQRRSS